MGQIRNIYTLPLYKRFTSKGFKKYNKLSVIKGSSSILEANSMIYFSNNIDFVRRNMVSMVNRFSKCLIENYGKSKFESLTVYRG